jgi:membrane associated rhomboid family serine protease
MGKFKRCHACAGWAPKADAVCPHCGADLGWLATALAAVRSAGKRSATAATAATRDPDALTSNVSSLLLLGMFVLFALPILAMSKNPDFSVGKYLMGGDSFTSILLGALTKGPPIPMLQGGDSIAFIPTDTFRDGQYWRLIAAVFLHSGIMHIGFNAMALAQLGPKMQRSYGPGFLMALFVFSGAFGYLVTYVAYTKVLSVGASGAVFGLIGVGIAGALRVNDKVELRTYLSWLIGSFLISFFAPINNWAHGGGLAFGLFFGWLVPEHRVPVYPWMQRVGSVLGALATVLVVVSLIFAAMFARSVLAEVQ